MAIPTSVEMASGVVRMPLVVDHACERGGSLGPDTRYELPVGGLGIKHARKRTEASQQQPRGLDGHTGRGGKRCFSGVGPCTRESLSVCGTIAAPWLLPSRSQS